MSHARRPKPAPGTNTRMSDLPGISPGRRASNACYIPPFDIGVELQEGINERFVTLISLDCTLFTPVAHELLEGTPQFVHVKIGGLLLGAGCRRTSMRMRVRWPGM